MSTASPRDIIADTFGRMHQNVCYPTASDGERIWAAEEILSALTAAGYRVVREGDDGWQQIGDDHTYPPHDVPVLLWSPPSMAHPDGLIEARPFSTGRRGVGWSEYSQHSYATHWRPQPEPPAALRALVGEAK